MPNAVSNRVNPHFKSQYADLAAIREASLPSLTKHGLSIIQTPRLTAVGFVLFSRLMHKSGQWIEGEWPITIGPPQSMGSQLTYFRRYLWSGQTGMAADEDDDANVAETAAKSNATDDTLGYKTLPKAKSRPIYDEMVKEIRALTTRDDLVKHFRENKPRANMMHIDFQRFLSQEYEDRATAIEEGVTETGEVIDDAIPESGAGEAESASG
jgi:hypothetical protein